MCLASNLVKEAAQHAASAKEADAVLRREHTTFTRREVEARRHDLVIIEDKVYDAETFQWAHPGGSLFVAMFGGRDGTLAFQSYHMRSFPHEKMRPYLRGRLCAGEAITRMDEDHLTLSKQLGGAQPYFAPRHQQYKAGLIWILAFALEAYTLLYSRTWALATLLGFTYAMIGLNIQHDANHGAMFKDGLKNMAWGLSQQWIGGSQVMWLQEHVVLHHMHTGDIHMDPDAQMAPAMRGHPNGRWLPWMTLQHYYFLLLEMGYWVVPNIGHFFEVLAWSHKFEYPLSNLAKPAWRVQSTLLHLLYYVRHLVLPALMAVRSSTTDQVFAAVGRELAISLWMSTVGGFYLAFFFFLSHNFDGVHFTEGANASGDCAYEADSGFLKQQAASSSNVGGPKLCVLNGGLNYQIEHHLFPRIAHSHYPLIAKRVRAFVTGKGGAYVHFDGVWANLRSVHAYLKRFSDPQFSPVVHGPAASPPEVTGG